MDDFVLNITGPKIPKPEPGKFSSSSRLGRAIKAPFLPIRKTATQIKRTKTKVKGNVSASVKQENGECLSPGPPDSIARAPNPLQFTFNSGVKKLDGARQTVSNLMSVPVEPRIEPVFSQKGWKCFLDSLGVHSHITSCVLERFKLHRITAIQEVAIPHVLERKDCLIRAQTGSGKTLAYALPIMHRLMAKTPAVNRADGVLALVILPTRELATQTYDVFQLLGKACVRVVPGCLIGGVKRKPQKVSLRKGLNIVVGTPQRILDHILRTVSLKLDKLLYLVIDEADRLLEMGFERDVRRIIDHIQQVKGDHTVSDGTQSSSLQTVLLSATLTPGVEKLAGLTLRDPVRCMVQETTSNRPNGCLHSSSPDMSQSQFAMPRGLKHFVLVVPWKLRLTTLAAFILLKCQYHTKGGKLVIFMATQDCVDFHHQLFKATLCPDEDDQTIPSHAAHMTLFRLHGKMEHSERQSVFHKFSTSRSGILLTTDVASRGLDLASVSWVVLYHVTGGPVDYVHRVGRTARAGGRGKALLFLSPDELGFTDLLRSITGIVFQQLSLPDLMHTALFHMRSVKPSATRKRATCNTVEEGVSLFSRMMLEAVEGDPVLEPLAGSAYVSFLRAYASFSGELRACFTFKRLHLGHVARAFCLQAAPKDVAKQVTGRFRKKGTDFRESRPTGMSNKEKSINKRTSSIAFETTHMPKRPKLIKPVDKAKRDMLAEFGL